MRCARDASPRHRRNSAAIPSASARLWAADPTDEIEQYRVVALRRRELVIDNGAPFDRRWMWPERAGRCWCSPSGAQSIRRASGTHVKDAEHTGALRALTRGYGLIAGAAWRGDGVRPSWRTGCMRSGPTAPRATTTIASPSWRRPRSTARESRTWRPLCEQPCSTTRPRSTASVRTRAVSVRGVSSPLSHRAR